MNDLIAVIPIDQDVHLIPRQDWMMHVIKDRMYCPCAPTAALIEHDAWVIRHYQFSVPALRRRLFNP